MPRLSENVPPPRFVAEQVAAERLGMPPSVFRDLVATGRLPGPVPDVGLYDVKALDAACDRLSGLGNTCQPAASPFDQWLEKRSARHDSSSP